MLKLNISPVCELLAFWWRWWRISRIGASLVLLYFYTPWIMHCTVPLSTLTQCQCQYILWFNVAIYFSLNILYFHWGLACAGKSTVMNERCGLSSMSCFSFVCFVFTIVSSIAWFSDRRIEVKKYLGQKIVHKCSLIWIIGCPKLTEKIEIWKKRSKIGCCKHHKQGSYSTTLTFLYKISLFW